MDEKHDARRGRIVRGARFAAIPLLFLGVLQACGPAGAESDRKGAGAATLGDGRFGKPEATLVRTGAFHRGEISTSIKVSTDIEAEYVVDVFPKVGGTFVKDVLVREGDPVVLGQPLALLDDVDFEIAVRQRESDLLQARETLQQMAVSRSQAEATERAAKALFEKAAADQKRAKDAMAGDIDVLSVKEMADLESEYLQREAEHEAAKFSSERAAAQQELSRLGIDAAQIELEKAQNDLDQCTIRSPIDGIVQRRDVNAGLLVSPSSHLFTIVDPTRLIANLRIPQEELRNVNRAGLPVEFTFDALPGQVFAGVIEAFSPAVDPASGLIRVRARLDASAVGVVLPGMYSLARIVVASRPDAVLVTKRAVVYEEGRAYVFSVQDGVARRHLIEIGASTRTDYEVLSIDGAAPDLALDVIVVGQDDLRDGDAVEVAGETA